MGSCEKTRSHERKKKKVHTKEMNAGPTHSAFHSRGIIEGREIMWRCLSNLPAVRGTGRGEFVPIVGCLCLSHGLRKLGLQLGVGLRTEPQLHTCVILHKIAVSTINGTSDDPSGSWERMKRGSSFTYMGICIYISSILPIFDLLLVRRSKEGRREEKEKREGSSSGGKWMRKCGRAVAS